VQKGHALFAGVALKHNLPCRVFSCCQRSREASLTLQRPALKPLT